jgi:hypothetical protein
VPATGDPAAYELAYEAGLQAVDEQASALRETRDRAGALMSAAVVTGGLVAGLAFRSGEHLASVEVFGAVLSIGGFIGVVVTTVMIWRPTEVWLVHNAGIIVGSYVEADPPRQLPEVHRELALWLGKQARSNQRTLDVRLRTFTWGLGLLLVEIAGAVLALGGAASG